MRKPIRIVTLALSLVAGSLILAGTAHADAPGTGPGTPYLVAGDTLTGGQALVDGAFTFALGTDGNFVLTDAGHAVWANGQDTHPGSYIIMQTDGNLVEYAPGGAAVWNTGTSGHPGADFIVTAHGLSEINEAGFLGWSTPYVGTWFDPNQQDVLFAGQTEGAPGQQMTSTTDGFGNSYSFYEASGVLQLYRQGTHTPLWLAGRNTTGPSYALMQSDGNFVLYEGSTAVWSSGTGGHPASYGYYLHLQYDGNLVLYSNWGVAEWATNTVQQNR